MKSCSEILSFVISTDKNPIPRVEEVTTDINDRAKDLFFDNFEPSRFPTYIRNILFPRVA